MNKAEVISQIAIKTGLNKSDVQTTVETFFRVIQQAMVEGKNVHFKGFGRFFNKKRSKKIARNLTNNTAMIINEHYVPTLKISKDFVNKVREALKDYKEIG
ncbi:MAG: integration host factor subunit beta [Candidatus Amoebophilus sp. 36-38]|nr:MAG: integration host factor subunit beta [Candidatus Amoebophilus sp. 36-38]